MTDRVDLGPRAGDYERFRVGYGSEVYAYVGKRLAAGPDGRGVEERNQIFVFAGRTPGRATPPSR